MTLDFWFDYSCPYAYLASTQVESLAARTGARLAYKPMHLGQVVRALGTPDDPRSPTPPSKARHRLDDLERLAQYFGVPLSRAASEPLRSEEALLATLAADARPSVVHAFFRACWVEGLALHELSVLQSVLESTGLESASILHRIGDFALKVELQRRTDEALRLGIFGTPFMVVNGTQLFWGPDRLHFAERALRLSART